MRGHHTPGDAVYAELNEKRAHSQHGDRGRKYPERNHQHSQTEAADNGPAPSESIGSQTHKNTAEQRTKVRNHRHYRGGLRGESALCFEEGRIHVLSAVTKKPHEGQKNHEINKPPPIG